MSNTLADLAGQTVKIFVPAIGIVEGVVQTVGGDPAGIAKIFVPGIGIIEGVAGASSDVWSMVSGGMEGLGTTLVQNTAKSITPWLLIGGGLLLVVILFEGKR